MILVTGGAGYVGSHACAELLDRGEEVVVLDNLCNSSPKSLERVEQICGKPVSFVKADIRDQSALEDTLDRFACSAVMHFAGLKSVQDSVRDPLHYYDNNVVGTHRLLVAMKRKRVTRLVFSSSATVYGVPKFLPYTEDHPLNPVNPYGRTKLVIEDMLRDQFSSDNSWGIVILRYFNPIGAHPSGLIGEDPRGMPNNLLPYIAQVATGRRERLHVFGGDYDTPDGTGIRDYVHVMDLAAGHAAALKLASKPGCSAVNLGTGAGNSVLDVVSAFERASGRQIPYDMKARRPGDIDAYFASTELAARLLGWTATRTLATMCADHWRWQIANPSGYDQDSDMPSSGSIE
jgi:UDP-glucose 4-epimerase